MKDINSNNDFEIKDFQEDDNNLKAKKKRVSYRAKANDFEKKKNLKKTESPINKNKNQNDSLEQIKVLSKNKDKKIEKDKVGGVNSFF